MTEEFHKPTKFSGSKFEGMKGGEDPATISRIAHDTAHALLGRVRDNPEPAVLNRLVEYTDEHGIDAVAELWSRSSPRSLPGALWRLYLVRAMIRQDPEGTAFTFQRGSEISVTIDQVVAGASTPTGPTEILELADEILRGVFEGDFAVALDRAAAFCRVTSEGCTSIADDVEVITPERATELTKRALRLARTAAELTSCARLWRMGGLE
ncbi:DNA-directed RNA polymerase subunit beta [Planctomonas deserti]|uniref:DNA-directed RNA polymerase subunit beta n=1 Tax=Planctomonas deserti TaxID=2144185 RepID=UPI000D36A2F9|nr:DNA-directed RNA polymerase subunit beta [Planctomonas deserti]